MALGLIPICSNAGFNSTIVGKYGCILPLKSEGELYGKAIESLHLSNNTEELSIQCRKRIYNNYSSNVIVPKLYKEYLKYN